MLQLLAEHLAHWSCSVAFPELAHLSTVQLRSLAKALPAERFRTQVGAGHCSVLQRVPRSSAAGQLLLQVEGIFVECY